MPRNEPKERRCILKFEDVSLVFDEGHPILDRVSFEIWSGETRILLGAAGAGKTVMMKIALGLLRPTSGKVLVFGQDVTGFDERKWFEVRSYIGVLFQEGGLFDSLTVEENVAYPLLNQARFMAEGKKPTVDSVKPDVQEALNFVELGETLSKFPSELSGGMRRRVGIARGSVTDPELFLYDSPTAGLDPITANTIITLLIKDRELRNTTTAIITHRFQDGHLLANFRYNPESKGLEKLPAGSPFLERTKFMVMQQGRLVFEGTEAELAVSKEPYISKFSMHPATKVS